MDAMSRIVGAYTNIDKDNIAKGTNVAKFLYNETVEAIESSDNRAKKDTTIKLNIPTAADIEEIMNAVNGGERPSIDAETTIPSVYIDDERDR